MTFQPGEYLYPFWGKKEPKGGGLDDLGIENSSQVVFKRLLPGLTNATYRIRIYGFFCWVLEQYQHSSNLTNNPTEQYRFLRRAELLLAFLMYRLRPEESRYSGKDYASRLLQQNPEVVDLANGAAFRSENSRSYWKDNRGALVQNYAGALGALNLITSRKVGRSYLYIRTNQGKQLADAYDSGLKDAEKKLFIQIIRDGSFKVAQLDEMPGFLLDRDIRYSDEWSFYLEMLRDTGTFSGYSGPFSAWRRDSLLAFLTFIQENAPEYPIEGFLSAGYLSKGFQGTSFQSEATFAWYYYRLNEYVHYAEEAVFWAILQWLDREVRPLPLEVLLVDLVQEVLEVSGEWNAETQLIRLLEATSLSGREEDTWVQSIRESVRDRAVAPVIWASFQLLISVYRRNLENLEELDSFSKRFQLKRRGEALSTLREWMQVKNSLSVGDWFRQFLLQVINVHLSVAMEKLASGKNFLKLVLEEGNISRIEVVTPTFTGPRLWVVYLFFSDLRLIQEEGDLTLEGIQFLKTLAS